MDVAQAVFERRSIRRFTQEPAPKEALLHIAEAGRVAPTGMNRQPLQFAVISGALCKKIFPYTAWAARIPDGSAGPDEATQPTAYIALLVDQAIAKNADTDCGAAAMAMMLAAQAKGLASCWLGSLKRAEILSLLSIDGERFALHTMIAFGFPAMRSRAVPMVSGDIAYYLESKDSLCVPKRDARDVIHFME